MRHPAAQGGLEERVAGECVGSEDELEEAERVVEGEREEAGGGGEEEEAAGGGEAGGDRLGVDLEEVARGAAPRELRVTGGTPCAWPAPRRRSARNATS